MDISGIASGAVKGAVDGIRKTLPGTGGVRERYADRWGIQAGTGVRTVTDLSGIPDGYDAADPSSPAYVFDPGQGMGGVSGGTEKKASDWRSFRSGSGAPGHAAKVTVPDAGPSVLHGRYRGADVSGIRGADGADGPEL